MKAIDKKQREGSLCLPLMPDYLPALTLKEVAKWLQIGKRTLERWIAKGTFPEADLSPNARVKRWFPITIRLWIDEQGGPSVLPFAAERPLVSETKPTSKGKGTTR